MEADRERAHSAENGGDSSRPRLGELLVTRGAATPEQIEEALSQQESGALFGQLLVDMGTISQSELLDTLAEQFGVQSINLDVEALGHVYEGTMAVLQTAILGLYFTAAFLWRRRLTVRDGLLLAPYFLASVALVLVDVWFQRHGTGEIVRQAGAVRKVDAKAAGVSVAIEGTTGVAPIVAASKAHLKSISRN